ncbi:MAG: 1-deoxy-D-xylulose-5-phosphate synthase [Calditrichaeota bacterium]|nr:1-deoxy-D-xylulose-5-phosphate synthase [Calditrichota bacterium]
MQDERGAYRILPKINSPADLRQLDIPELSQLARELRDFIITTVSCTGGHLAPSLGVVELTLALHYAFDTPRDKIIWDVGHQAYPHKIITGRREQFATLRQWGGISGFPRREESPYDVFGTGHASTSISAALGIACARDFAGDDYAVVAVIGDGSMSGGLAFEGLNNAGALKRDLIVILNDNRMSISRNVGALAEYLTQLITAPAYNVLKRDIWELTGKLSHLGGHIRTAVRRMEEGLKALIVPGLLFERLGFRYFGPIDGHNIALLVRVLREVRQLKGPIFLHVLTTKGKGYLPAEKDAPRFHGLGAFNKVTGDAAKSGKNPTYTEVFGKTLVEIAAKRPEVVGITAAMELGTGLCYLHQTFPERFFDVGIAEAHAVTFAGGLAVQGLKPVVAIYSTFLQRAYDQIIHDIALQNLPVVFALDRGGLVGDDGPTHHGSFDLSYLRSVPNLVVAAPKDENELKDLLWTAVDHQGPFALRYPRGEGEGVPLSKGHKSIPIGSSERLRSGHDVALLGVGPLVYRCREAAERLAEQGISCTVVNVRFVKPMDEKMLRQVASHHSVLVTVEDNTVVGGFGSAVAEWLADHGFHDVRLVRLGLPDQFVPHGTREELYAHLGLDTDGIARTVLATWQEAMRTAAPRTVRAAS